MPLVNWGIYVLSKRKSQKDFAQYYRKPSQIQTRLSSILSHRTNSLRTENSKLLCLELWSTWILCSSNLITACVNQTLMVAARVLFSTATFLDAFVRAHAQSA